MPQCFCSSLRGFSVCTTKYLSTSSVKLGENAHNSNNADKGADSTETQTVNKQPTQEPSEVNKLHESNHGDNVKTNHDVKGKEVSPVAVKSGKENLLHLLRAMKVDVTSKKRLKNEKVKQSLSQSQSTPALKSTISMFQRASEEASAKT